MIPKLALTSCLLLLSLLEPFFAGREAIAISETYGRSFIRQLQFIASKKPKYTWGGASDLSRGLDCSGYMFLAGKWAGLPGIVRTTSYRMSMGLGGWSGSVSTLEKASQCDLVFWTFSDSRPNGHVGAVIKSATDQIGVVHASQSRGVIFGKMNDYLKQKTSMVRKLAFGD